MTTNHDSPNYGLNGPRARARGVTSSRATRAMATFDARKAIEDLELDKHLALRSSALRY